MKQILTLLAMLGLMAFLPASLRADNPKFKVETTLGDFVLELDADKAPITTLNFLKYAEKGYYDGTIFHRVMDNFMIQGGGWTAEMEEKSGQMPPIANEWKNGLANKRGTIAMARMGGRADSATSEFFINVADNPGLDQPRDGAGYAVFGSVVEGMDTVDKIKATPVGTHPKYADGQAPTVPQTAVVIKSVKLVAEFDRKALEEAASFTPGLRPFLDTKAKEIGKKFEKTESGIYWATLTEGKGPKPASSESKVEVHYRGTLLDGSEFDSSYSRNQTATFGLNQVIKGWTEGVGAMNVGEKRILVIPPGLAYGAASKPKIPANSTLVFEVELISLK